MYAAAAAAAATTTTTTTTTTTIDKNVVVHARKAHIQRRSAVA